MMRLTTRVLAVDNSSVFLGWKTGGKKFGVLRIDGVEAGPHMFDAAELVGIRFLIFQKRVFNRHPFTGSGYAFDVESREIAKPGRGRGHEALESVCRFFHTNLKGAIVERSEDMGKEGIPAGIDEVEAVPADLKVEYDILNTPAMGKIRITGHAIERYAQHHHAGTVQAPVYSMLTRLSNPNISRQAMPTKAEQHKIRRYGTVENVELWGHSSSQIHFVVIRDKPSGIGTVVTVFRRHPAYMPSSPQETHETNHSSPFR